MITRPWKFMCYIATFVGIHGTVELQAAVNMISVEHRIWGDAGESPANYYDETGSVSLSRSISSEDLMGVAYFASSSAGEWSVTAYRLGEAVCCNGFAQNTYIFKPLSRQVSVSLGGEISNWWFENDALMTLTDLNTDSVISIYQSPSYFYPQSPFLPGADDMVAYPIHWEATVEVNPEHEYELILFVGAHNGEGGYGSASLDLILLPEPRTTLLVGVAVLLMCSRRQRPVSNQP